MTANRLQRRWPRRASRAVAMAAALMAAETWGEAALPETPAESIPILAWQGPPSDETTLERYRELADAGFTLSLGHFPDLEAASRALDVAQQTGVRLILACPELTRDPLEAARRLHAHPALAGYNLADEPGARQFAELARWAARLEAADPRPLRYVNLFPSYASSEQLGASSYEEYVARFLSEVPVQMLSFDHYPITFKGLRANYYDNLRIVADAAQRSQRPLWAFVLSVAHDPYPQPELGHLKLQALSNLAHGARVIQYFTYWTPEPGTWNFHDGPIGHDGRRTATYDLVKQTNRRIAELAPLLAAAQWRRAAHVGAELPAGTAAYVPRWPVRGVEAAAGAIVAEFAAGPRDLLMVVNRDYAAPQSVRIALAPDGAVADASHPGVEQPLTGGAYEIALPPGEAAVLVWERSAAKAAP